MVEYKLPKLAVAGSSPVTRSTPIEFRPKAVLIQGVGLFGPLFFLQPSVMQDKELKEKIQEIVAPVCTAMGVELWGIETSFSGRKGIIRIYIDSPQGVGIEDCTSLSREAGTLLEVEDLIHGSYRLEVSSPGLDRVFFSPQQLADYTGREVRVIMNEPIENRSKFTAKLASVSGSRVCIAPEGEEELCFDFYEAKKIKLLFKG